MYPKRQHLFLILGFVLTVVSSARSQTPDARAKPEPAAPVGSDSDALPQGALARLGSARWWHTGVNQANVGYVYYSLAFSADGKMLATVGTDGSARLWDVAAGKELRQLTKPAAMAPGQPMYYGPSFAAFSADGKVLGVAEANRPIRLMDTATGKELRKVGDKAPGGVLSFTFAPDGKILASANREKVVRLWETDTGKEIAQLEGHQMLVSAVAFAPDGKTLASGSDDLTIRLWDVETRKEISQLEGHRDGVRALAFAADGKTLVSGGADGMVRLWDLATGKERRRFEGPRLQGQRAPITRVALSSDGKMVSALGQNTGIRVWDAESGKNIRQIDNQSLTTYTGATFSPDGTRMAQIVIIQQRTATVSLSGRITLIDLATGTEISRSDSHNGEVTAVAYAPDGKTLATGCTDRTIRLWDLAANKEIRAFHGHIGAIGYLAFTPDGKNLVSASSDFNDKLVSLWNVATGQEIRTFRSDYQAYGSSGIALARDGKTLATAGPDGMLCLWDVATRKELPPVKCRGYGIAIAPDGKTLAGSDLKGMLNLWDVATGAEIRPFGRIATNGILRFSPDGRILALGSIDGSVRLYEVASGKEVRLLNYEVRKPGVAPPQPTTYRTTSAFAFSPDGKTLIAIGKDNTASLWELATGKERHKFAGHQGAVMSLAFSPDGRKIVSGSADSTALIWDVLGPALAGHKAGAELTAKELDDHWTDLGNDDAAKGYRAMGALSAAPRQVLPLFKEKLQPAATVEQQRIDKLVEDLDSSEFPVRKQATEELEKLGELAEPALRKAKESKPSLEVARRLDSLLQKLEGRVLSPEQVRTVRAIEVLELLGTAEARQVLDLLAKGAPGALPTREAKFSLERLTGPAGSP